MAERTTREQLELAAYYRFAGGYTWEQTAEKIGITVRALRDLRKKQTWRAAQAKIIAELRDGGSAEAWGCLMRACRENDVTAAKEVLARLEGPVAQKTQIGGDPDNPVRIEHGPSAEAIIADPDLRRLAAELVGRASSGATEPGEPGTEVEPWPVGDGAAPEATQ